jgi:hypothetical protein
MLAIRFIVEMDHFEAELKQLPLDVLSKLTEPALKVKTLDGFEVTVKATFGASRD